MSVHRTAVIDRARRGIADRLTRRGLTPESAAAEAAWITDAMETDGWRLPPDTGQPPHRNATPLELADPHHARSTAEAIRAEMAEARARRKHAEAEAEEARDGRT